jgi:hypothetical protein
VAVTCTVYVPLGSFGLNFMDVVATPLALVLAVSVRLLPWGSTTRNETDAPESGDSPRTVARS